MSDSEFFDVAVELQRMRGMPFNDRTRRLQVLLGPKSEDPHVLQRRALLISALREAELWPMRPALE